MTSLSLLLNSRRPRLIFFIFFVPTTIFLLWLLQFKIIDLIKNENLLENIFTAEHKPRRDGKTIFFLETRTDEDRNVSLQARQACSVEAAGELVSFELFKRVFKTLLVLWLVIFLKL